MAPVVKPALCISEYQDAGGGAAGINAPSWPSSIEIKKVLFAKLQLQCFKVENAYPHRKPMPGYLLVKDRKEPDQETPAR